MKVTVLQENLKVGLARVNRVISSRPQLPILANILIVAEKGKLKLAGTDLELGIQTEVGAKVEVEGKTTVPAKAFFDFMTSISPGKVEMGVGGGKLKVVSGRYRASFQTMSADEYPQFLPKSKNVGRVIDLDFGELKEALQRVVYAAARDSMRPVLTGVLFEVGGGGWRVVATDGFRLALHDGGGKDGGGEGGEGLLIPSRSVGEVMKLRGERVRLKILKEISQVVFEGDDEVIVSQLLEGSYPNYRKIIPKEAKTKVVVLREEMLEGVGVAQVFARDNSNILKWEVGEGRLVMRAESPELGENVVELEARIEGVRGKVAFNARFLLDFLQSARTNEIEIGLGGELSPGSFREKGNDGWLYIVMPINL